MPGVSDPADIRSWFADDDVQQAEYVLRVISRPEATRAVDDAHPWVAAEHTLEAQAVHATGRRLKTATTSLPSDCSYEALREWVAGSVHPGVREDHGRLEIGDIWLLDDSSGGLHRTLRSPEEEVPQKVNGPAAVRDGVLHLLVAFRLLHGTRPTRILPLREKLLPFAALRLSARALIRVDRDLVLDLNRSIAQRHSDDALERAKGVAAKEQAVLAAERIAREATSRSWRLAATNSPADLDDDDRARP